MRCRECGSELDRPGDYCLICLTSNTDTVVLDVGRERGRVVVALDGEVVGERVVTTVPESDDRVERKELRNFAGRIADEVLRKRPDEVYIRGDSDVVGELRANLHYSLKRLKRDESVDDVLGSSRGSLDPVDIAPDDKLGGSHTTLIGGKTGMEVVESVVSCPYVKKVVPGPITSAGGSPSGGYSAKATRADPNGNLRLLIRDGSSVQENRVVTTASNRQQGERIRRHLNEVM